MEYTSANMGEWNYDEEVEEELKVQLNGGENGRYRKSIIKNVNKDWEPFPVESEDVEKNKDDLTYCPISRRSTIVNRAKEIYSSFELIVNSMMCSGKEETTVTYHEAISKLDITKWKESMDEDFNQMIEKGVWSISKLGDVLK